MKRFLITLFCLIPMFALADTQLQIEGKLTDEQKAKLQLEAAQMANQENQQTTVSSVKQWVDVGQALGSGLASTAKELGVAANDFIKTPVGKLTAFIIIWHFVGGSVVHATFGVLWLLGMVSLWTVMYRRQFFRTVTTYYDKTEKERAKKVVVREPLCQSLAKSQGYSADDLTGVIRFMFWLSLVIISAIGVIFIAVA